MSTSPATQTPKTFGPYSAVRTAGPFAFVSGQVGVDPVTGQAPDSCAAQIAQAVRNMERLLTDAGSSLQDVVQTTVFLTDMDDFPVLNEQYTALFREPFPARACVAVRELPRVGNVPLRVEIAATAWRQEA